MILESHQNQLGMFCAKPIGEFLRLTCLCAHTRLFSKSPGEFWKEFHGYCKTYILREDQIFAICV